MLTTLFIIMISISSTSISAQHIDKVSISISENNGLYTSKTTADITGSYDRLVNRILDFGNYPKMGISYINKNKIVENNGSSLVVWSQMNSFLMSGQYYTKINVQRGPKITTVKWHMVQKGGYALPENHKYQLLRGATTVKLLSDNGKKQRFHVDSMMQIKFKPGTLMIKALAKNRMRSSANKTLNAFTK